MKLTSASSAFSLLLHFLTHKYVVSSHAAEVGVSQPIEHRC